MSKTPNQKAKELMKILYGLTLGFLLIGTFVTASGEIGVTWEVDSYYSDTYNINDVTFVWSGDTGTSPSPTQVAGSNNAGAFSTTYTTAGEKTVNVYAKNSLGETVSNTASCTATIGTECPCQANYTCVANTCVYNMDVSCAAYTSEAAVAAGTPTLFFDPGSEVYWHASVDYGDENYTFTWAGDATGDTQTVGAYFVHGVDDDLGDYETNDTLTSHVRVSDGTGETITASCTVATKQCATDDDCVTLGYGAGSICDPATYTCRPPLPVFVEPLTINPSVINEGEQCGLAWAVDNVSQCDLYKDNTVVVSDIGTTTAERENGVYSVDPGTFRVQCENVLGETIDAGPVRCLYNPNVKEL